MKITRRQIKCLVEQVLTQSDRKDMTHRQEAIVAEVIKEVGSDDLLDIKHDDNNAVSLILRDGRKITVWADGTQHWFQHDKLHRDDGPAVIRVDGAQEWWLNNRHHRSDGPAVIWADGTQRWFQHDKLHRDNGPAVIYADGTQSWFQHGKRHRKDGPAVIWADGTQRWWLNDKQISEAEHARLTDKKNSK